MVTVEVTIENLGSDIGTGVRLPDSPCEPRWTWHCGTEWAEWMPRLRDGVYHFHIRAVKARRQATCLMRISGYRAAHYHPRLDLYGLPDWAYMNSVECNDDLMNALRAEGINTNLVPVIMEHEGPIR